MMIENDEDLKAAVAEAGGLIQAITDYTAKNSHSKWKGRIRFPRGFLRPNAEMRHSISFVSDNDLRSNISYAIMTHDVLRWIVFHTDLNGQAREMMIKEGLCILGAICESISIFPEEYGLGRGSGFKRRISRLRDLDIIDDDTVNRANWLWDKRNQEHLHDIPFREWSHYNTGDWYRSVRAYHALRDALATWRSNNASQE